MMNIKPKDFFLSLGTNLGPLAPFLVIAAAASVWFASASVNTAASNIKTSQFSTGQKITIEKQPISQDQAMAAAQHLTKLVPETTVAVSGNSIVISIMKPELFAQWVHALNEAQSVIKDVQWEVEDLCIASCEAGESAKAYLSAYKRHLKITENNSK